jgi:membrane-associated protease RseP (regulator of RpoE activity)
MSDEPTSDDTTPDAPAPGDTSSASVLDTDTTEQVPVSAPVTEPTPAAASPSGERRGVFVPRWLAIFAGVVAAVLLVGGGGFALGRATADDDSTPVSAPAPAPTPDDRPSTDDRPQLPDVPDAPEPGSAYLGVSVDATSDADGVEISEVAPGSPAADAGLEAGDVITEIDGDAVTDFADLASVISDHDPDDEVEITYERDGESTTLTVTLGERPEISGRPGGSESRDSDPDDLDEDSGTD